MRSEPNAGDPARALSAIPGQASAARYVYNDQIEKRGKGCELGGRRYRIAACKLHVVWCDRNDTLTP